MASNEIGIRYAHMFKDLNRYAQEAHAIDDTNVYQKSNINTRKLINSILDDYLLPESHLEGLEHFEAFYNALNEKKRGLILVEHFSNMDLPAINYLLERSGKPFAADLSDRIVAIAGMKLNEENPMIKAWAEGFTRVVIYPSRSLALISDPTERAEEEAKSRKINMASMHAMNECKKRGEPILVFPSGTRYRANKPETRNGLREIDSYLRMFDVMILVTINGSCLRMNPNDPKSMLADLLYKDTVLISASSVMDCKKFRNEALAEISDSIKDKKPIVVEKVMNILKEQHDHYQPLYLELYKKAMGKDSDYTV